MQQSYLNSNLYPSKNYAAPQNGANAVSINIFTPQAYGNTNSNSLTSRLNQASNYTHTIYPSYNPVYDYSAGHSYMPYPQNYINGFTPNNFTTNPIASTYPNGMNGYNNGLANGQYPNGMNGYNNGLANGQYPNGMNGYN
ncbi:MAG: hypothetical protein IJ003_02265, partial [Candidatus Gastranaerophilales bacterium]|nr:hypothetical protein [Candidatus Gastranaerophilales bacterium]